MALACALASLGSPAAALPPHHEARLVVPKQGHDHSAYRFDTEVFGWNADFSEVASVCMEVMRGPLGRHRGETYMLVYRLGETRAKHNITCHSITHADLPHNPLPLLDAKEFLWSIENSYQAMWPMRPHRAWRKSYIRVAALWAAMPTGPTGAGCTPWVSLRMDHQGERRFMPWRPLDMTARCELIEMTDVRTYWGRPDIAASMVRFDFAGRPANEESARFVLSAAWRMGRTPTVRLRVPHWAVGTKAVRALKQALAQSARVVVDVRPEASAKGELVGYGRGRQAWLPLVMRALQAAKLPLEALHATDPLPAEGANAAPAAAAAGAATAVPSAKAAAENRAKQRQQARFGILANASDDAMNQLGVATAGGEEGGLVAGITLQHDPIEDAFEESEDSGAESPPARPASVPRAPKLAPAAASPALAVDPLPEDTVELVLHVANAGWPPLQAPQPMPSEAGSEALGQGDAGDGAAAPVGRQAPSARRRPASGNERDSGGAYLQDWSPAAR